MKIMPTLLQAAKNGNVESFTAANTPVGIEAQEAAGQKSFVANQTLPKDCPREELEKFGFIFGDDADDIFINVKFPESWKKKPAEHSMWSDLIDNKGRIRGEIFYKASYHDRRAYVRLIRRYSYEMDYKLKDKDIVQFIVFDCNKEIYKTEKIECKYCSNEYWAASDRLAAVSVAWLDEKFPNWKDETAYWD